MDASDPKPTARTLEAVRARLDVVDRRLLELIDERAALASEVAAAKAAAGEGGRFALRPPREAEVLRNLLARPRKAAPAGLVVRIWRELMSDSLSRQGPYHVTVFGRQTPEGVREAARMRFGAAPPFSSASGMPFSARYMKVGVTLRHAVAGVPRHLPAPRISPGPNTFWKRARTTGRPYRVTA